MEKQNDEKQVPDTNQPSDKGPMDEASQDIDEKENQIRNEGNSDDSDFDCTIQRDRPHIHTFHCKVCYKRFSGLKPLLQHEKSAKHYKMLHQKKVGQKINQKLEDDQSGSLEDFVPEIYAECDTCKKQFTGPESYHQHLTSKVHHKKVAEVQFLEKVTENGKVDVEKLKEIYKQKRMHQKDISEAGAAGNSPTLQEAEDYDQDIADSYQFECNECDKKFTGVNNWYQHLVSKTHEKTLKQRQLFEKFNLGGPSRSSAPIPDISPKDMDAIEMDDDGVLVCHLCHKSFSGPESVADHLKSRGHAKKKEMKEWKRAHSVKSAIPNLDVKKTKALDIRNESQVVEDSSVETLPQSSPQKANEAQFAGDVCWNSEIPNEAAKDLTTEVEDDPSKTQNTLLCYKSYKAYKKIMNEIESKDQLM